MTKKAKKRAPKKFVRGQRSPLEKERRLRKLVLWGLILVSVSVVGILSYGFVYEKIIKARRPVAVVGEATITTTEFQARTRYERLQANWQLSQLEEQRTSIDPEAPGTQYLLQSIESRISNLQTKLAAIGVYSLEQLIEEELVRQETERRGIYIAPEELQREIESSFGRNPLTPTPVPIATLPLTTTEALTPTPTTVPRPTPTVMSEEAFEQSYNDYLQTLRSLGVSEQMFRSWIESSLLLERLQEQMKTEIPAEDEQTQLRFLAVESEERASELAARLEAGEEFQSLKEEMEADEESTGYASEPNWYVEEMLEQTMGPELASLAFTLEVGERSEPTPNQDGTYYFVLEILDRQVRELEEWVLQQRAQTAFQEWLDSQKEEEVERMDNYIDLAPTE